jgi:hypothetical protein
VCKGVEKAEKHGIVIPGSKNRFVSAPSGIREEKTG